MNTFADAGVFLVNTFLGLYAFVVLLRLLFQLTRVNFNNTISQFVFKLTSPPVRPLQRFIPVFKGVDGAVLTILLSVEMLKVLLVTLLNQSALPNLFGALTVAIAWSLQLLITTYFWAILIRVILSWVNPLYLGSVSEVLYVLTEPILRLVRTKIQRIGGLDLSPLFVLIGLQLASILLVGPLLGTGIRLLT